MKDELGLINCKTFKDVEEATEDYLDRVSPKAYGDMIRNKANKDGRSRKEQPSYMKHSI